MSCSTQYGHVSPGVGFQPHAGEEWSAKESNKHAIPARHQMIKKELSGLGLSNQRSLGRKRKKCGSSKKFVRGEISALIGLFQSHRAAYHAVDFFLYP